MPATLTSNRGGAEFVVELGATAQYGHEQGFDSKIHLRGSHWDIDHEHPFSTSVDGIWLRTADLTALRDHIHGWTSEPLDRLVVENLSRDFELARLPGQSIYVSFGPRPDTIAGLNPVISIALSAGALRGEFHFVTDQSCLALFSKQLSAEIRSAEAT